MEHQPTQITQEYLFINVVPGLDTFLVNEITESFFQFKNFWKKDAFLQFMIEMFLALFEINGCHL